MIRLAGRMWVPAGRLADLLGLPQLPEIPPADPAAKLATPSGDPWENSYR